MVELTLNTLIIHMYLSASGSGCDHWLTYEHANEPKGSIKSGKFLD